jgi:hypothetical protein
LSIHFALQRTIAHFLSASTSFSKRQIESLSLGLAREITLTRTGQDLLLYVERRAYLMSLYKAWGGVEGARVTLAKACYRLGR